MPGQPCCEPCKETCGGDEKKCGDNCKCGADCKCCSKETADKCGCKVGGKCLCPEGTCSCK